MADFSIAFTKVLVHEGGYANDSNDPGGETYKGVARNMFPKWNGWAIIDALKHNAGFPKNLDSNKELQEMVKTFYETNFWSKIKGNDISNQDVATSIFDFAVNTGVKTSALLAQKIVGATADGIIGQKSIAAINSYNTELFNAKFTIEKITHYIHIVEKRPTSRKFFYGWIRRAIGE